MLRRICDRCNKEINTADYYEFTLKAINARKLTDREYNLPKDLCNKCAKVIINSYETFLG